MSRFENMSRQGLAASTIARTAAAAATIDAADTLLIPIDRRRSRLQAYIGDSLWEVHLGLILL